MYFQQGCEIKAARALAEMDQGELAKAAGLHRNSVSAWEATNSIPDEEPRAVRLIREALSRAGVDVVKEPFALTLNDAYFDDPLPAPSQCAAHSSVPETSEHS